MVKFNTGHVGEIQYNQIGNYYVPYRDIVHTDGLIRVEYYTDTDPDEPSAYAMFRERMGRIQAELTNWQTLVVDPLTAMYLAARKNEEKVINPIPAGSSKYRGLKGSGVDPRQWYGGGVDALEEMLCIRFIGFINQNVVLITHIDERKNEVSGEILRGPSAPGRLGSKQEINAFYQEQYHAYTDRDENGERVHLLRTKNDGKWCASTLVDAPDPMYPHYDSMWENWTTEVKPKVKTLVYGNFGTGKSTFAQTFPKPMLVFCFDGKDIPYWKTMAEE
jgi:hypothetical protein